MRAFLPEGTVKALEVRLLPATLTFTPTTLPDDTLNQPYDETVTASGGTGTYTYSLSTGTLPTGLSLDASTGAITGTPSATGTSDFTISANDTSSDTGSQAYAITVNPALTFTTTTLPDTTVGASYDQTIATTGGTGTPTFAVTGGTLPAGLNLSSAGVLSGTPTTAGTSNFTVTATDSAGASDSEALTETVNPAITFTTTTLPTTTAGVAYNQTISTTGGTSPVTFAVTSGTPPTGLTLSSAGVLSGTPSAAGTYDFTVTATDNAGATATQSFAETVNQAISFTTASLPATTVGSSYSQTIVTTGGTGTVTYALTTGTLPPGLTLSSAGVLSGTPTTTGTYDFTVTATDSVGASTSQPLTATVNPAITFTTTTLPATTVNTAYSQQITATGGNGTFTYAVTTGTLPAGLILGTDGLLSGTPTTAGTSNFTVTATDGDGDTGSQALALTVNPALAITATTLPSAIAGTPYDQTIGTTGGTSPVTFAVTSGTLPTGLTLTSAGVLSGTVTSAGSDTFGVTATDAAGATATQSYTFYINPYTLSPTSLPNDTVGIAYDQTVAGSGGAGGYTYNVSSGTLPAGLALDSSTGAITGTPTTAGTSDFTITATDSSSSSSSQPYAVTINPALAFSTTTLPDATLGASYDQTIATTGGTSPITFAVTSGTLPAGLALSSGGVLSGTPTTAGTSDFTVTATDSVGDSTNEPLSVTVNPAITFTTTTLPATTVGASYSQTIATTGGTSPVTFAVTSGTLPAGLALSSGGVLSGTPTTAGTSDFTVTATDSAGATTSQPLSVTVNPAITFTTTTLPDATVNTAYSQQITATGGTGTLTYTVTSGTLPAGLTLSTSGLLSGTPTASGTSDFTVTATDSAGGTASEAFTELVNPAITFTTTTLPDATINTAYSQQITATGGTGTLTYTVTSGTLPTGLTLSTSGLLSGTPTTAGTSSFTVTATDANGATDAQALTLNVNPAVTITTTTLPDAAVGSAYSQQINASGGSGTLTYTVTSGTLPVGITLSTGGLLSGTPSTAGTSTFTVTATDANGATANQSLSLTVDPAIIFSTTSLPDGTVNTAYSQQITATGGSGTLTYSVTSGSLPSGLNLSSAGLLSGTPTNPGTSSFTVTATDTNGATADQNFSITINAASTGLTVTNLQRFGFHEQPTIFVVTFSEALATGPAQTVSNYTLVPLVNGQVGLPITISSAVYNASNDTVTLTPAHNVYLYGQYQLTVNGTSPSGLTDTSGNFLAGTSGQTGTNYVKDFGDEILAGPNIPSSTPTALANFINNEWTNELAARFAALAAAAGDTNDATSDAAEAGETPARVAADIAATAQAAVQSAPASVVVPAAATATSTATSAGLINDVHTATPDDVLAAIVPTDTTDKKKS